MSTRRDAGRIRTVAETLRGRVEKAEALRSTLAQVPMHPQAKTVFDIFGSELPEQNIVRLIVRKDLH
jgi:hypothetical protein